MEIPDSVFLEPLVRVTALMPMGDSLVLIAERSGRIYAVRADNGQVVYTAGQRGAGPGEFNEITFVSRVAEDTIAVFDQLLWRITYIDSVLHYAGSEDIRDIYVPGLAPRCLTSDGGLAATVPVSSNPPPERGLYTRTSELRRYTRGGGSSYVSLGILAEMPLWVTTKASRDERMSMMVGIPFSSWPVVRCDGARLIWGSPSDGSISTVYDDRTTHFRVLGRADRRVSQADRQRFADSLAVHGPDGMRDMLMSALNSSVETMPAFMDVVPAHHHGDIWALDYRQTPDSAKAWSLYDSAGTVLERITVPRNFDIGFTTDGGAVWGVWTDSNGVPHIRVYKLEITNRAAAQ